MPRVFLAERLTGAVLERFARRIASADACTAVDAPDSAVASRVLTDARWHPATIPLWDEASARAKDWIRRFVFAQPFTGQRALLDRALIACSLDSRLRTAAPALVFFEHCAAQLGVPAREIDLEIVADDPYLRDGFQHGRWLAERPRSLRLAHQPGQLPWKKHGRELLAAQGWLRVPPWRRRHTVVPAPAVDNGKTVMIMAISRRSIKLLEPSLLLLRAHGWRVVVCHYGSKPPSDRYMSLADLQETTVSFDEASAGWRTTEATAPKWVRPPEVMRDAPLSSRWLDVALAIGWTSAVVQVARHRQLLRTWRPDVVFGYGPDVPNLALQVAADELSIPTLFAPHGFEVPARTFYHFVTTATPLYGPACAEVNTVGPHGQPFPGLVPTGHPPYDALVAEFERSGGRRKPLPGLTPPPSRPHLILALAGWGFDLICHLHQERFLEMLARALPADAYLVCKLHPGFEERRFCEAALAAALPPDAYRVVGEAEFTTGALLAGCHVAVSNERSMVLTDAIVMGTPSIAVRHPESPLGAGDRNHPGKDFSRNCWLVSTSDELRQALAALTHEETARARLLAHRREYLDRFVMGDGHASERLAGLVEHLAAGKAAAAFRSAG